MSHIEFDYLHFEPAPSQERLPLVVYLHGAGQKGSNLDALAKCSLPSLLDGELSLPATVVCPLAAPGPGWPVHRLAIFIEEAVRIHSADPRRIYLTGESMGGRGVFEVSYWHADLLAAAVPLCAFGIPNLAPRLKDLPIWMFHGSEDDIVPVARAEEMAAALTCEDAPFRLTVLEASGHDIGEAIYSRPDLWEWMFSKSRDSSYLEI